MEAEIQNINNTAYSQFVAEVQFDKATVEESRKLTLIIAAEDTGKNHRNHFIYNWDNWSLSNFNSNPIVGYQHNVYGDNMCLAPNPDDVIAKAVVAMDKYNGKRALVAETTFEPADLNPTADKVLRKMIFGSLRATSVGVNPMGKLDSQVTKNDKGEVVDYQIAFAGQELLEFSIVNIPADPQALRRSMKSHTFAALNFVQRSLPELSMNDLRGMKVQDILDLMEGKKTATVEQLQKIERNLVGADPNVDKYISRLNNLKRNK